MVDVWSLLLGWGAGQGLLLAAVLLLRRGGNARAHRWLALLVLGFTSLLVEMLAVRNGHFFVSDGFIVPLLTPVTLALGPTYLVYTRALLGGARDGRLVLHFVPAALSLANLLPALGVAVRTGFPDGPVSLGGAAKLVSVSPYVEMTLFLASLLGYTLLGLRELRSYESALVGRASRSPAVYAGWLRKLSSVLLVTVGVVGVLFAGMLWTNRHVMGFEFGMALAFSLVIHATGAITLWQPQVFASRLVSEDGGPVEENEPRAPVAAQEEPAAAQPAVAAPARYERSGLSLGVRERLVEKLRTHMREQRPYLDPELSRGQLAAELGLSPHRLSELLSEGLGVSFFDFVNGYRVDEVKRRLLAGEGERLTILAVALESGFASKASFNRVFKRLVGETPTGWLRSHREPTRSGALSSTSQPPL